MAERTPDKQGLESVIKVIEQVFEDICDNYCMYRDTVDDECLCDVTPDGPYVPAGTGRKDRSKYGAAKRGEDAKNRAKTFPGIAKAMAEQWAGDIN